jgi:hypothetical protein
VRLGLDLCAELQATHLIELIATPCRIFDAVGVKVGVKASGSEYFEFLIGLLRPESW